MTPWALLLAVGLALQIEPQPQREAPAPAQAPAAPQLTRAPELRTFVDAEVPPGAEALAGEVVLLLTLDETGRVAEASVQSAPDPRLAEAALAAGRRLVFSPAEVDGVPAPVQLEFRYVFTGATAAPQPAAEVPARAVLRGTVRVRGRRDPLSGAVVVATPEGAEEPSSTTTDAEGGFELALPPGPVQVSVRAPGFETLDTEEALAEDTATEATYYLLARARSPYETVVRGEREAKEVTRVTLAREEVTQVPGTFGDPLRVLENLPGMARAPYLGGRLLVRGASPEDSGVHFDGVEIPLLYHFGGLTSVVNPEFIELIDFYPGGFGSRYGRSIAGVVEVESRRLTGQRPRGSFKADLMDASLALRQPLGDTLAVAVAARRSYVDTLLPPVLEAAGADPGLTLAPVYFDYQAKVDFDPHPDHQLSLFGFGSRDTFALVAGGDARTRGLDFDLTLAFHRLVLSHRWRLGPDLTLVSRPYLGLGRQAFGGGEVGEGGISGEVAVDTLEAGLREELRWRPSERLGVRGGLDLYGLWADAFLDAPVGFDLLAFPSPLQSMPGQQTVDFDSSGADLGAWAEATWTPLPGLAITPGLRVDLWRFPGARHWTVDPRLAVRWQAFAPTVLKAAVGRYHQAPGTFQVNALTGNPALPPERARHWVLGVEHRFSEVVDLDLEGFYVERGALAFSSDATRVEDGEVVAERYAPTGVGRAFGAEVLLRHGFTDRFFGWAAYTLMKAEVRPREGDPWRPTAYDQTHILTLVASYQLVPGLELGARFRLVTGNPYTPVLSAVHDLDSDTWVAVRGPENSARMPTFHQLDLRADYTWTFDLWRLSVYLDLINAYDRRNIENFQYDYRYQEQVGFSLLPVLPVLGLKGEW